MGLVEPRDGFSFKVDWRSFCDLVKRQTCQKPEKFILKSNQCAKYSELRFVSLGDHFLILFTAPCKFLSDSVNV